MPFVSYAGLFTSFLFFCEYIMLGEMRFNFLCDCGSYKFVECWEACYRSVVSWVLGVWGFWFSVGFFFGKE